MGLPLKRAVRSECPEETAVALAGVRGSRAEADQRPVRCPFERGEDGQRLEVRLLLLAGLVALGQISLEDTAQLTRLRGREGEDTEVELVVADDIDEVTPANDARGGVDVALAAPSRACDVQVPQLAQLEGRQLLGLSRLYLRLLNRPRRARSPSDRCREQRRRRIAPRQATRRPRPPGLRDGSGRRRAPIRRAGPLHPQARLSRYRLCSWDSATHPAAIQSGTASA